MFPVSLAAPSEVALDGRLFGDWYVEGEGELLWLVRVERGLGDRPPSVLAMVPGSRDRDPARSFPGLEDYWNDRGCPFQGWPPEG